MEKNAKVVKREKASGEQRLRVAGVNYDSARGKFCRETISGPEVAALGRAIEDEQRKSEREADYMRYGYAHKGFLPPEKKWVSRLEQAMADHWGRK